MKKKKIFAWLTKHEAYMTFGFHTKRIGKAHKFKIEPITGQRITRYKYELIRKNPLVDRLKRYAKRGASFGLNKLNTYAQTKLKNPQARATGTLFDTLRHDPYLYQKVYSPAAQMLLRQWRSGKFDRMQWLKKFRTVAEHTARTLTRTTGRIATRPEKMRFAFQLAKGFWDNVKR